ncbi:hypothetical protein ACO0QE_003772 [Hanseniaspora vineae]
MNASTKPGPVKKKLPRSLKACDRCKVKKQRCEMSLNVSMDVRCLACQKVDTKCSLQELLQPQISSYTIDPEHEAKEESVGISEPLNEDIGSAPENGSSTSVDGNVVLKKILEDKKSKISSENKIKKPKTPSNAALQKKALSTSIYTQHYVNSFGTSTIDEINVKVSKILEYLEAGANINQPTVALFPTTTASFTNDLDPLNNEEGAAPIVHDMLQLPTTNPKYASASEQPLMSISSSFNEQNQPILNATSEVSRSNESTPLSEQRQTPEDKNYHKTTIDKHLLLHTEKHLSKPEPTFLLSPFATFSRLVQKLNVPLQVRYLHDPVPLDEATEIPVLDDVISSNILTLPEVIMLVREFKDNYGTWVSFPENVPVEDIVDAIRKSHCSVLLTTACVLALRYTVYYHDLKTRIYKNLLFKLKYDLEKKLVSNDFSIEFIQSLVMMSIYSSSLSSDIQTFDAWSLSAMGIQFYISHGVLNAFKNVSVSPLTTTTSATETNLKDNLNTDEQSMLERLRNHRLWNHLVLVHLTYSVLSGRMSILNKRSLRICFDCLELPNATHFDGRMIAEISLYSILYEYTQNFSDVKDVKEPLNIIDAWYAKWNYLTTQPLEQFVDFSYHFSYVLMIYMWYHHKKFPSVESQRKRQSKKSKEQEQKEQENFTNANGFGAQRTFNGERLNKKFPLSDVFGLIPLETQKTMLEHCEKGLKLFVDTRIHNFRYLSDQLIFISVYLSLITLKTLKNVCEEHPDEIPQELVKSLIGYVKQLSMKLRSIRESELKSFWVEEVDLRVPSVILQYHSSLESYLKETFPEMVDSAKPL